MNKILYQGFVCLMLTSLSYFSYAQSNLVKDINSGPAGLEEYDYDYEQLFVKSGNNLFFPNGRKGRNELWKTDGTVDGTQKVIDISKGYPLDVYSYFDFTDLNGKLFFPNYDADHGLELWYTDGTTSGTGSVDVLDGPTSSSPSNIVALGNKVYFFVLNSTSYKYDLWQSDGTKNGTSLVKNFSSDNFYYYPLQVVATSHYLYFLLADASNYTLWRSDGTEAGTILLNSFSNSVSYIAQLTPIADKLYFALWGRAGNLSQLWITDGSVEGTTPLVSLSDVGTFFVYNDKLIFPSNSDVWISDGTVVGTSKIYSGGYLYAAGVLNNVCYMIMSNQLVSTDGTAAGSHAITLLTDPNDYLSIFGVLPTVNNKIIVEVGSAATGHEIGISDGTQAGTQLLKDVWTGSQGGSIRSQFSINGKVLFVPEDGVHGTEIWVTDGTPEGTQLLKEVRPGTRDSNPAQLKALRGNIYYTATSISQPEIWYTQPSNLTTQKFDIGSDSFSGIVLEADNDIYFISYPTKFCKINTAGGITVIKDWSNEFNGFGISDLTYTLGSSMIFTLSPNYKDGSQPTGQEYWITDGIDVKILKDINPGPGSGVGYEIGTVLGSKFFFTANDGTTGRELWISDGTDVGTVLLADINPGANESAPDLYETAGDQVFFSADDGVHGKELWKTDGTTSGTQMVKDIVSGSTGSNPTDLIAVGSTVFFAAYDDTNGWALWKSDGTAVGTVLVKDVYPGTDKAYSPYFLKSINGKLFFAANDGQHGEELWVSDGTSDGTKMMEIVPGAGGSNPGLFTNAKGVAYFEANKQIWASDGTTTKLVADAEPIEMIYYKDSIYFSSISDAYGIELFVVPFAKMDQTITFTPIPVKKLTDSPFPLQATATSGLPVSFSTSSDKATIQSALATLAKAGSVTIHADQPGNDVYNAAQRVDATFCINPSKPTITESDAIPATPLLTSSSDSGNQWFYNGTAIDGAVQKTYTANQSGAYTVQVTVDNCVSDLSEQQPVSIMGIEDTQFQIKVYPNPASDKVRISVKGVDGETVIEIFDMKGQSVDKIIMNGDSELDHSIANYPTSVYLARAVTSKGMICQKIVKK